MLCPHCKSTHTLLPHFAVPYHTYSARTIMEALRLYVEYGSYHLVKHMIEAVRSRAVVRQWAQRFSKVIDELIKGLERFLGEFGQDVPSRWKYCSAKDPPLKEVVKAFIQRAAHAAGFLSEQQPGAVLPEEQGDLLGWTHLLLVKTEHLFF